MKRTAVLLVLVALLGGCTLFENGMKTGTSIAFDELERRMPAWAVSITEKVEAKVQEQISTIARRADEKVAASIEGAFGKFYSDTGISVADFDANGDGLFGLSEVAAFHRAVKEENEKRKERGEDPIPLTSEGKIGGIMMLVYILGSYGKARIRKVFAAMQEAKKNGDTTPT